MRPPIQKNKRLLDKDNPKYKSLLINISKLSEGLHNYHLVSAPVDLRLDERFDNDIDLDVILDKTSTQIFLKTEINTSGNFECDRCLSLFKHHIHTSYNITYMYKYEGIPEEGEIQIIDNEENYIDISEDVRQFILLAIPIKLLCKEDCKGLCPRCGKNLNNGSCECEKDTIDPRWEVLKNLIDKKNN